MFELFATVNNPIFSIKMVLFLKIKYRKLTILSAFRNILGILAESYISCV